MTQPTKPPARLIRLILSKLLPERGRLHLIGDYEEYFQEIVGNHGRLQANTWMMMQLFILLFKNACMTSQWSLMLIRNTVTVTLRHLKKQMLYTVINIIGLSIGLTAFILIMLFVRYEQTFDQYHTHSENIYQIPFTPLPLAAALMEERPEVVAAARIWSWGAGNEQLFAHGDMQFHETMHYADPEIFDIFTLPMVHGSPERAFDNPYSVLLSQKTAEKYFGNNNPVGQILTLTDATSGLQDEYTITGVFEDMPAQSHFRMKLIVPFENLVMTGRFESLWNSNHNAITYIRLHKGADPALLGSMLASVIKAHTYADEATPKNLAAHFRINPLKSLHLDDKAKLHFTSHFDVKFLHLYTAIAVLVLLVACINTINLATARSMKRSREVGIRKVIGARRGQLIRQFLSESFILLFWALALAVLLVILILPTYSNLVARPLSLRLIINHHLLFELLTVLALMGMMGGAYPAFYLSSVKPISALTGKPILFYKGFRLRNTLVIAQFAITTVLIIGMSVVNKQLHFIQNKNMGFSKEQVIFTRIQDNTALSRQIDAVKAELIKCPQIKSACCSGTLPNDVKWRHEHGGLPSKNTSEFFPVYVGLVDYDFVDVYGIDIVNGRNFDESFSSEAEAAVLINEAAAAVCSWEDAIGKTFKMCHFDGRSVTVVGIMKDFHSRSLHEPIKPLMLALTNSNKRYLSIKMNTTELSETLDYIERTLDKFDPHYPYAFQFFDEAFEQAYRAEQELGSILQAFALLSIVIGCMGLWGLTAIMVEHKTKEIGIRKVVGSSTTRIIILFLQTFLKWILLAVVIAWPGAYLIMNRWLQNFAYRIKMNVWIFLFSGLVSLCIALLTVGIQTFKASLTNPVDSLRHE